MKRRKTAVIATIAALVMAAGGAVSASAAEAGHDEAPLIAAMLEEVPGGILVDEAHVVWPELDMELIVLTDSAALHRAVKNCATGRICAYDALSLGGNALTFGTCGDHTIPSPFPAKSLANARTSGYVQARSGSTVVSTVSAGAWKNVAGGFASLRCYF